MMRLPPAIGHLLLIALLGLLAADVVSTVTARQLVPGPRIAPLPPSQSGGPLPREVSAYARIVDRNLFDSASGQRFEELKEQPAPTGAQPAAPPRPAPPPLRLLGTVVGEATGPYAVIHDESSNKQQLIRIRDRLADGWLVAEIRREQVVLQAGKERHLLEMKYGQMGAGAPRQEARPAPGPLARPPAAPQEDQVGQVLSQANFMTFHNNGRPDGAVVAGVLQGPVFEELGLRQGDLIKRINGQEVTTGEAARQLLTDLIRNRRGMTVEVLRGNEMQTLTY
ncbi:MAG: hypothetical protein HYY85_17805 [Deltaproteobacteria bacterium]|nr:hypothetical protein [Deltaproteobacteria bacterium]